MAPSARTGNGGFGRWLALLAAALLVVCVVAYRVLLAPSGVPASSVSAALPRETEVAQGVPHAAAAAKLPAVIAPAATAAPAPTEAAPAEPVPTSSASSEPSNTEPPPRAGTYRVTIKSVPTKARFFRFGKQVGVTPFVLELPIGERRAYEAGLPGHVTRRVVVDGSKSEITVGLRDH